MTNLDGDDLKTHVLLQVDGPKNIAEWKENLLVFGYSE